MKQFIVTSSLVGALFLMGATRVSAQTLVCNNRCDVNEDCGQGYKCYVGVCRAAACPSSLTCGCTTPVASPIAPVPSTVPLNVVKATPIASASANVKTSPKTGASESTTLLLALAAGVSGIVLKNKVTS